jgi:putative ABC transport system permease protein
VLSLALAIALNTTMYSVIDALVNPKLEVKDPERLYWLTIWGDYKNRVDESTRAALLRTGFNTYESITLYTGASGASRRVAAEHGRNYAQASVAVVAPNFFSVLGARPISGRAFLDSDVGAESQPVVITDALADALFRDGESPIGQRIDLDGNPTPVIGVVSRAAHLPEREADVFRLPPPGTPLSSIQSNVVRLQTGVSAAVADKQLHVLSARFAAQLGVLPKDVWFQLSPMKLPQFRFRNFHWALIAAVVAVLLVACANLANLQLARGIGRSRELALRAALGASRADIVAQLVLESSMLAGAGLVLGTVMTYWGVQLLSSRIPPSVASYIVAPETNWRVLVFAILASVVCVMLVGLVPAIRVSRVDPNDLLKTGAGTGASRKNRREYGMMVIAEIGLSLALLSGAAVVVRSAIRLNAIDVGYDVTPLSSAWMRLTAVQHDSTIRYSALLNQLASRTRSAPDVADATAYLNFGLENHSVTVYGKDGAPHVTGAPMAQYKAVSASYLHTYGLRIVRGRDFLEGFPSEPEVIVDQKTADALWHGADPIGERIKLGDARSSRPWVRVVGVTGGFQDPARVVTSRASGVKSSPLGAIYYLPGARDSVVVSANRSLIALIVARSRVDHERMPITLKRHLAQMAPMRVLMTGRLNEEIWRERASHDFVAAMFSTFAALAIGLAALGIYGIVTHSVAERKRELGVRIALGATSRDILRAVLREGNVLALSGVAVGLLCTKYTAGWLLAFSREDDQYDAPLFAAMALILFIIAVIAALIPAMRATRIDAVESLRSE